MLSSAIVTEPELGSTIQLPRSYELPNNSASYKPCPLIPSVPATSKAVPGVNVLAIAKAIGCPGVLISNLYLSPLYNFIVGFGVFPSGVKI